MNRRNTTAIDFSVNFIRALDWLPALILMLLAPSADLTNNQAYKMTGTNPAGIAATLHESDTNPRRDKTKPQAKKLAVLVASMSELADAPALGLDAQ